MADLFITSYCRISNDKVVMNGKALPLDCKGTFAECVSEIYKYSKLDYPKFSKMDNQSKLGLLATELLMQGGFSMAEYKAEEVGLVLSNAVSSVDTDLNYLKTISNEQDYFPSPSLFVYTLANVVAGEICIRHQLKGENAFFISKAFNENLLCFYISSLVKYTSTKAFIAGWVNYNGEDDYDALLFSAEARIEKTELGLSPEILHKLYHTKNGCIN